MDYIYDVDTQNKSFLEMAYTLKTKGVKNNKFMLKLYDASLVGVDPYSPNLTSEQKAKIYTEICRNWWYFIREVEKIPQEGSTDGVHFQLNVGNMAAAYCAFHNINHLFMVPRQVGKTVVEVSFSLWVHAFSGSYIKETYLHKAQSGSIDNLGRLKKYKELLPYWLQQLISDRDDKDNLEEKFNNKRKNTIVGLSSAHNDAAADKLGRGSSTAMVYMDEFAFLERNEIVWAALIPAWKTSSQVAKANGAPYGIRITTTPNNLALPQASFCYTNILLDAYRFTYSFYDIPEDEITPFLRANSGNDFVYIQYEWQECGKTKDWFEDQCRLIKNPTTIKRELLNVWPESDKDSVFEEKQLELVKHYCKAPELSLMVHGYQINFFEKPDFLMNYIFSCDVSGGLTLDRSVINIIDPRDFRVVGLFWNSKIDTEDFKELIRSLLTEWFVHGLLNIENNSYGLNIIDSLIRDPNIEPRMYREEVERQGEKTLSDGFIQKKKTKRIVYGTSTNQQSRKLMMDILPTIVDECPEVFVSEDFYNELKALTRSKSGKIEARQGYHDDIVMSYLITRYAITYGKCFKDRFHILPVATQANGRTGEGQSYNLVNQFSTMIDTLNAYDEINYDPGYLSTARDMMNKDALQGYVSEEEQRKINQNNMFDLISRLNNSDEW